MSVRRGEKVKNNSSRVKYRESKYLLNLVRLSFDVSRLWGNYYLFNPTTFSPFIDNQPTIYSLMRVLRVHAYNAFVFTHIYLHTRINIVRKIALIVYCISSVQSLQKIVKFSRFTKNE